MRFFLLIYFYTFYRSVLRNSHQTKMHFQTRIELSLSSLCVTVYFKTYQYKANILYACFRFLLSVGIITLSYSYLYIGFCTTFRPHLSAYLIISCSYFLAKKPEVGLGNWKHTYFGLTSVTIVVIRGESKICFTKNNVF